MQYSTIIWDWNGTLLDDLVICTECINRMLLKRSLPQLTRDHYREVFTFPVRDYYEKIGFDFSQENWDLAAHEFIHDYLQQIGRCGLTDGALEALAHGKSTDKRQAILSAMQHSELEKSVTACGIAPFFDYIGGIENHYADGKLQNALSFFRSFGVDPATTLLVGDTLHDAEVARAVQCHCVLVAAGHQSAGRLLSAGFPVISSLRDLPALIA